MPRFFVNDGRNNEKIDRKDGKSNGIYRPVKALPSPLLIVLCGFYLFLIYCAQLVEEHLETPLQDADITVNDTSTFSEETAWRYVNTILGSEPRVAGTPYHLQKTADLKALVDEVASNATLPVHTDWQFVTGDYYLDFSPPFVNYYQNVSNVIAVLEGESGFHSNGSTSTSLLLNCHYDSVPYAQGVSDNVIFCGVILEVLSKLSKRQEKLQHNIVFLFNGAEENPLQGSHGFLQHPWSEGCTNVINLDSAGINGKPNIFQATDHRVLELYRQAVTDPQAQSLAEYLFTAGVIPSDTDFRVFRDFADIHGLDIAFVKGGAVYHTRNDEPALVRAGVLQQAGAALLPLAAATADLTDLEDKIDSDTYVYYDYLGWFMVTYTFTVAYVVDITILVVGVLSVVYYISLVGFNRSTFLELSYSFLSRILAAIAGTLLVVIVMLIMVNTTGQLRYLSRPWLVVPLFCLPYAIAAVVVSQYFDSWRCQKNLYNRSIRSVQAEAANRIIVCIILFVALLFSSLVTVRYLISVVLLLISAFAFVELTVVKAVRLKAWQHLLLQVSLALPAIMFVFTIGLKLNSLMIPLMGRNNSLQPDYTVAGLNIVLTAFALCILSGQELLFSRRWLWGAAFAAMLAVALCAFIPLSPYSNQEHVVQRHYWFHSEITTYNFAGEVTNHTSGVVVTQLDAYTTSSVLPALQEAGIELNYTTDFEYDCEYYVHCNLPFFRTKYARYLDRSLFLYTGPPSFVVQPSLDLLNRTCANTSCTLQFRMTGPDHNLIALWPKAEVNITSWSLDSPVNYTGVVQERLLYDITHSVGTYSDPWPYMEFDITMTVPTEMQNQSVIDISYHAHRFYDPESLTTEINTIMAAMPDYAFIGIFESMRLNYEF